MFNYLTCLCRGGGCLVASMLAASLLICLANLVPTAPMIPQLKESYSQLRVEGQYHQMIAEARAWQLDNFTNALMLSMAGHGDNLGVEGAFAGYKFTGEGTDGVERLGQSIEKKVEAGSVQWTAYARYWNGWTVVLKPLLLFLNLNQIRTLFFVVMSALIAVLACASSRLEGVFAGSVVAVGFAAVSYPAACFSLSLSFCFFVALAASLVVVRRAAAVRRSGADLLRGGRGWPLFFLMVGCVTAFFDFLCTPIITLGVPLALLVFLSRHKVETMPIPRVFLIGFLCCASWAVGYAGLWVSKWVISSLILGWDVVSDAVGQLLYRTGDAVAETSSSVPVEITAAGAIAKNVKILFPNWALKLIGLGAVCLFAITILRKKFLAGFGWHAPLALVAVSVLPYFWYAAVANHSWVHYFFTYRGQLVTLVALGFAALPVLERVFRKKNGVEVHD